MKSTSAEKIQLVETAGKQWQRYALDTKYRLLAFGSRWLVPSSFSETLADLGTFCCFIGHGRSGGTLVGALLNAHPNVVMSNELNALRRIRMGMSEEALYRIIYIVSRRQVARGSRGGGGYSYAVPGQWQGRHQELLVIGDRKAGASAQEIIDHPATLERLERNIRMRKRFVHVARNPFDTIATTFQKTIRGDASTAKLHLDREIRNYFIRCEAVRKVEARFGTENVWFLHHEDLVEHPDAELGHLCTFLGITPHHDYLGACASIVAKTPHKSRMSVSWEPSSVEQVRCRMREFHWLERYSERNN
jgi:hypothetical protein